jgi:hypothetical protein
LLFFIENPDVDLKIENPLLRQDIVNDYKSLNKIQNDDIRRKMIFFKEVEEKNKIYYNLLRNSFEDEFAKIKDYLNMKGLVLYIMITLLVLAMIMPVLMSAM